MMTVAIYLGGYQCRPSLCLLIGLLLRCRSAATSSILVQPIAPALGLWWRRHVPVRFDICMQVISSSCSL
jgi:hypothetical protein